MPKYYEYKVYGYYLYYTSHCVIEAMHVHASDRNLTEAGSAKFFVQIIFLPLLNSNAIILGEEYW